MKYEEMKSKIREYMYLEDTDVIDVVIGTIISNQMKMDSNIWLAIVGESSGGKSQIIKPFSKSHDKYMIKIDDLTDNTFLSGQHGGKNSLLSADKTHNMLLMSDLTVLFSRSGDTRNAILGQFRMLYDGEMTKYVGTLDKPLTWKGRMGVLAGCTPKIYKFTEEVSDMGERFIYYRLKENNPEKATRLALERSLYGSDLDDTLSDLYREYMEGLVRFCSQTGDVELSKEIEERIIEISIFAERLRTPIEIDQFHKKIVDIPVSAMPMRTALQLKSIAKGLVAINNYEGSEVVDVLRIIDWLGFSLAGETKRKALEILSALKKGDSLSKAQVGNYLGLDTEPSNFVLQNLTAIGIIQRDTSSGQPKFFIKDEYVHIIQRIMEGKEIKIPEDSEVEIDHEDEMDEMMDSVMKNWSK